MYINIYIISRNISQKIYNSPSHVRSQFHPRVQIGETLADQLVHSLQRFFNALGKLVPHGVSLQDGPLGIDEVPDIESIDELGFQDHLQTIPQIAKEVLRILQNEYTDHEVGPGLVVQVLEKYSV